MEGMIVFTSIKLEAKARKIACQRKLRMFVFDRSDDICIILLFSNFILNSGCLLPNIND